MHIVICALHCPARLLITALHLYSMHRHHCISNIIYAYDVYATIIVPRISRTLLSSATRTADDAMMIYWDRIMMRIRALLELFGS